MPYRPALAVLPWLPSITSLVLPPAPSHLAAAAVLAAASTVPTRGAPTALVMALPALTAQAVARFILFFILFLGSVFCRNIGDERLVLAAGTAGRNDLSVLSPPPPPLSPGCHGGGLDWVAERA